jgi:hypothetical protein
MIAAELRDLAHGLEKARSSATTEELDRLLSELCNLVHESGLMVEFNWIGWRPSGRLDRDWIESADLEDLRRYLTCHIQNGRFIEGHLRAAALDSNLIFLLERIANVLAADGGPPLNGGSPE